MWIIVLLACLCVTLDCGAQEVTSTEGFAVTEFPRANKEVDWDTTRSPVTLSIRTGQSNSVNRPQNYGGDQDLLYSNQWKLMLMPINFNPYRANNQQNSPRRQSVDRPFVPTFLRRPDSNLNWTLPFESYPRPSQAVNDFPFPLINQFSPSLTPINPALFYPQDLNSNVRINPETSAVKVEQNASETFVNSAVTEPVTANYDNAPNQIFPTEHIPIMPLDPRTVPQIRDFRNTNGFYPHMPPLYYPPPYHFLSERSDALPVVNVPNPDFSQYDREAGSEVIENESPQKAVSAAESLNSSTDFQETEGDPSETVPSVVPPLASPSIPPPDALPLPLGAFPFGVYPPVLPPVLSNPAFPRVLPVNNPFIPGTVNVPRGNGATEGLEPHLHADDRLPLETNPEGMAPPNSLQVPPDVITELPIPEQAISGEKINAPKIPYEFGFDMNDGKGTDQHRQELSDGSGVVTGSYGYRDVFGMYRIVNYIADKNGFRAVIKSNEPGVASSGSANVIVMAEQPPPRAIAEGARATETQAVIVPDETADLIAEGSEKDIV